jgi:hypothetical protein
MEKSDNSDQRLAKLVEVFNESMPIYKQLPITVPKGGKISAITGQCGSCNTDIHPDSFRGNINVPFDGGPAIMNAYGFCAPCNTYTPFTQRVRGRDGRLTSEFQNNNGEWVWSPWLGGRIDTIRFRFSMWIKSIIG